MRYFVIPLLLLLISCSSGVTSIDPYDAQQLDPRLEIAREELKMLSTSTFETTTQFIIFPHLAARDIFIIPHWWSHWKEELDYREDNIPQGIISFFGSSEDEYGWGRSMKWKGSGLYQNEHFSFSKSGQLLAHVNIDSTLFFYDSSDRLRETTAYSSGDSSEIESVRLFDYDQFGNLIWNAVLFENHDGIYVSHYSTFSYHVCDSGFYVREEHHFVENGKVSLGSGSVKYSFFDKENVLRRMFQRFSGGVTGITFYDYSKFEGEYFLSKKERMNINGSKGRETEVTQRDQLNRITIFEQRFGGYGGPHLIKDSNVYLSNNVVEMYHFDKTDWQGLVRVKYDDSKNRIEEEYYTFGTLNNLEPMSKAVLSYEFLENGTWFSSISKSIPVSESDEDEWEEFEYRSFLNHPVDALDWTYQENPKWMKLIENVIPAKLRQKK